MALTKVAALLMENAIAAVDRAGNIERPAGAG
jgi:hypothetical protein